MSFRVLPNASRRVGMVIATGALLVASGVPAYADDPQAPPPFRLSGFAAEGRGHGQATVPISGAAVVSAATLRSEEHTSELQSQFHLVCRLLLEKKDSFVVV